MGTLHPVFCKNYMIFRLALSYHLCVCVCAVHFSLVWVEIIESRLNRSHFIVVLVLFSRVITRGLLIKTID